MKIRQSQLVKIINEEMDNVMREEKGNPLQKAIAEKMRVNLREMMKTWGAGMDELGTAKNWPDLVGAMNGLQGWLVELSKGLSGPR